MSKKKKKGYKFYAESGKGKKKNKKSKLEKELKLNRVKPSLDKKDAKTARKIVCAPVDVPEKFKKIRVNCNHAGKVISAEEFKAMTPAYAAYTPMLDRAIEQFGEENVSVCKTCYDVIVDPAAMGDITGSVQDAITVLYAAANVVLSHERLKSDEIKEIAKMRDALENWAVVVDSLEKIAEKEAATGGDTVKGEDLNSVGTVFSV